MFSINICTFISFKKIYKNVDGKVYEVRSFIAGVNTIMTFYFSVNREKNLERKKSNYSTLCVHIKVIKLKHHKLLSSILLTRNKIIVMIYIAK